MLRNLFERGADIGWVPDVDAINAPKGALLRADNIVPDELGGLALRRGSSTLYSGLTGGEQATGVHSMYSVYLPNPDPDGSLYDFACSGNRVYVNGVDGGVLFDGSGDVAFGDDSYQVFMARGSTRKKWDGENMYNWSIPAPTKAAVLSASAVNKTTFIDFSSAESPALTVHEGTSSFQNGYDGTASAAMELVPAAASGRAAVSKKWTSDQDCLNIAAIPGGQTDLIDLYIWLEEPRKVDKITIMFGLNTGADPFIDDYYYFDFNIRNANTVDIKDPASYGAAAYSKSVNLAQNTLLPEEVTNVKTPDQVKEVLARLGRFAGSRSRERADAQQNSPAWTHFTVTRGQFNRVGNTSGRSWSTVRGIKVVYTAVPGSTDKVRMDELNIIGGGDRVLTGTFRLAWRFVRDTGVYKELSPVSPMSDPITLNQQALTAAFPADAVSGADPQVNQIWVYLFGGFLDTFYRFEVISSQASGSGTALDEFDPSSDGTVDSSDQRLGMTLEMGWPGFTPTTDLILTIRKTEIDAIIENERLEPGAVGVPNNIVAVAGPHLNRMFMLTDEGFLYVTSDKSPSNCSVFHSRDLRRYGDPLWMARTNDGIVCGMSKGLIRITGSGQESDDRSQIDFYAELITKTNPPINANFYTDGNSVIYQSADGMMMVSGASISPMSQGQTSLLWRGVGRHGVNGLNISGGRFRTVVDNQILYMTVSEGTDTDPTSVWRYNFGLGKWSRTTYPSTVMSVFRNDDDGRLLAGTVDGKVLQLETGIQDDGEDIRVDIVWPNMYGDNPLARKVAMDAQIHCNTGGKTGTLGFYLDGAIDPVEYSFSVVTGQVYRQSLEEMGKWTHIQPVIHGSFSSFVLRALGVSYRELAQQMVYCDTGYLMPQGTRRLVWLQEIEVDCISPGDITVKVYLDDVLFDSYTIQVVPGVRKPYPLRQLPRNVKAARPLIAVAGPAASGEGDVGFECFGIRYRDHGTGAMVEANIRDTAPGGQ